MICGENIRTKQRTILRTTNGTAKISFHCVVYNSKTKNLLKTNYQKDC